MPHLLLINPNTSTTTSALLERALRPGLPPGVQLTVRTASFGARYIACESSHAVAGTAVLQAWAEPLAQAQEAVPQAPQDVGNTERSPLDGVLIGCFGDPGLFALREANAVGPQAADQLFGLLCEGDASVHGLAEKHGLLQVRDDAALDRWCDEAIAANAQAAADVAAGKVAAIGRIVGAAMKLSAGKGDAKSFNERILRKLQKP